MLHLLPRQGNRKIQFKHKQGSIMNVFSTYIKEAPWQVKAYAKMWRTWHFFSWCTTWHQPLIEAQKGISQSTSFLKIQSSTAKGTHSTRMTWISCLDLHLKMPINDNGEMISWFGHVERRPQETWFGEVTSC